MRQRGPRGYRLIILGMSELFGPTERMGRMGELLWLAWVWSSSAVAGNNNNAWNVNFNNGNTNWNNKNNNNQLRLVRSGV